MNYSPQLIANLSAAAEKAKIELSKVQNNLNTTKEKLSSTQKERDLLAEESKDLQINLESYIRKHSEVENSKLKLQTDLDSERSKLQETLLELKVRILNH